MIFKIWRWLKDYPTASLEVEGDTIRYLSLDREMNPIIAEKGLPEERDGNILLNLGEEDLGVLILRIEDSVGKKYIKNHLKLELKRKLTEGMDFDFYYKKVGRERYLVKYYRRGTISQIKETHNLENAIVSSSVIGYYNYWSYYKKNMKIEIDDYLMVAIGEGSSYLFFIEGGGLNYIRRINIGCKGVEDSNKRSKFIKEIDHTTMLVEQEIEGIFLLGESGAVRELQNPLKDFIGAEVLEVDVEQETVPYISMLGNLYSYHL